MYIYNFETTKKTNLLPFHNISTHKSLNQNAIRKYDNELYFRRKR